METEAVTETEAHSSSMDSEDTAHLAGAFDAIGGITVRVVKNSNYRINYTLRPMLRLSRSDENDPLLGKLMVFCDENGIKYSMSEKHRTSSDKTSMMWLVMDLDSIEKFLNLMNEYLVTELIAADIMLTEIIPAIRADKHRDKQGFYELMGVVDELRNDSKNSKKVKYDQEYFEEEWSLSE